MDAIIREQVLARARTRHRRGRRFLERYRLLHNRRGFTWWSTVFGYPLARLALVWLEPIRAITPTRITVVGFAAKLAAAAALLHGSRTAMIAAIALLAAAQILDSMDGTLARARGQHSAIGALADKLTDAIGLFAICAAVGVRAELATGSAAYPVLACAGAFACDLTCYMYWVGRALVPDRDAVRLDGGAAVPSWGEIRREWVRGWLKLPLFLEADLYLWIGVFGALGAWAPLCVVLAVTQGVALAGFVTRELVALGRAR